LISRACFKFHASVEAPSHKATMLKASESNVCSINFLLLELLEIKINNGSHFYSKGFFYYLNRFSDERKK
jgi:hypothetical protein